jgi:hypothetical protein
MISNPWSIPADLPRRQARPQKGAGHALWHLCVNGTYSFSAIGFCDLVLSLSSRISGRE